MRCASNYLSQITLQPLNIGSSHAVLIAELSKDQKRFMKTRSRGKIFGSTSYTRLEDSSENVRWDSRSVS